MSGTLIRSSFLSFTADPLLNPPSNSYVFMEDALLETKDGKIISMEDTYKKGLKDAHKLIRRL